MQNDSLFPSRPGSFPVERSSLSAFLPMRAGLNMADYHLAIMGESEHSDVDVLPAALCGKKGLETVIFSDDTEDSGHVFWLQGCGPEAVSFAAQGGAVWNRYGRCLAFVGTETEIFSFFTGFQGVDPTSGLWHFATPRIVYHRPKRQNRRFPLDAKVVLRRRDGRVHEVVLHDFSVSGASFFTDRRDLHPGEAFLMEFEVPECGYCETVVTTVRLEARTGSRPNLVAVRLILTEKQKKQVEHLLLCQEYPHLRVGK